MILLVNYNDAATQDDGSCDYCSCWQSSTDYTLTIESSVAVAVPGATTYRFYVNMVDASDQFSAVFGNNEMPLSISVPDGAFSSSFNASWSAAGINPAFLPFFPDMADDTYATINLTGPAASSGIADAADPSLVEDSGQLISPFFMTSGSTELLSTH